MFYDNILNVIIVTGIITYTLSLYWGSLMAGVRTQEKGCFFGPERGVPGTAFMGIIWINGGIKCIF